MISDFTFDWQKKKKKGGGWSGESNYETTGIYFHRDNKSLGFVYLWDNWATEAPLGS